MKEIATEYYSRWVLNPVFTRVYVFPFLQYSWCRCFRILTDCVCCGCNSSTSLRSTYTNNIRRIHVGIEFLFQSPRHRTRSSGLISEIFSFSNPNVTILLTLVRGVSSSPHSDGLCRRTRFHVSVKEKH